MAEGARVIDPRARWAPQPGPQQLMARTSAKIAWLGGSVGGGKSVSALGEGGKLVDLRVRGLRGIYFRRHEVSLTGGGKSIWDRATVMLPDFGGTVRRERLEVEFEAYTARAEDKHRIYFRHLHQLGAEKIYDGTEWDLVVFEELQEFEPEQFWYFLSRLRTTTELEARIRATLNAAPGTWLFEFLLEGGYLGEDGYAIPERSGVVRWIVRNEITDRIEWFDSSDELRAKYTHIKHPLSFTFILARLSDNPALLAASPGYRDGMRGMLRKERLRLIGDDEGDDRGGCWLDQTTAGEFFDRALVRLVDAPPSRVLRTVRGWDFGSSEPTTKHPDPDWTEGARVAWCERGELYADDLVSAQLGATATTELVLRTARLDGPLVEVAIFQDTGAAGKRDAETIKAELEREGYTVHVVSSSRGLDDSKDSLVRKARRDRSSPAKQSLARPWALLVSQGRAYFRRGAGWVQKVLGQMHPFPNARKDDAIDAFSCAVQALDVGRYSVVDAIGQRERTDADAESKARDDQAAKAAEWKAEQARQRPLVDVDAWAREHGRRT